MSTYQKMAQSGSSSMGQHPSLRLAVSYALDWIVLIIVVVIAGFLGRIEPLKRPFSLDDPNISFPFTEDQAVPTWLLVVLCGLVPAVIILIISVLLVPGATVPKKTPQSLIWKRKLWEIHVGWLGLLLSVGSAFFFISGIKNMCGKPRPDLLSRCEPDLARRDMYRVGGFAGEAASALLYSGKICQQKDKSSSTMASAVIPVAMPPPPPRGSSTCPSISPASSPSRFRSPDKRNEASSLVAFPSRAHDETTGYGTDYSYGYSSSAKPGNVAHRSAQHNMKIQSLRRQAAAPPIYLLVITLVPFCVAIFIAASRWFDFRHHGFDILFGFLIGTITAVYSFRYYHMPIQAGAGWAWGSRSGDRAFWAGVGRLGYVGDRSDFDARVDRADLGESADVDMQPAQLPTASGGVNYRPAHYATGPTHNGSFQDVELDRMERHHHATGQQPMMGGPAHPSAVRGYQ
ncbi:hypothetical protein L249_7318 [Ophiocordyceps polyrhachis-furcata BCC 54312]|uniref:Phosphatidic acid phosphatase type 2/haloperoxidase domain-containing protein n=1 Tax=Ophiocordyceps polyrhachis-furcata BCC 54312 TaxID=1330021 RepID=A0A367L9Y5_9HYPO|nr:hypothetical protein L249_7318 [Ophiocordyceps polyrhachis-furcata BCC 54312]